MGLIGENDNNLDEEDIKKLEDWGVRIKRGGYLSECEKLSDNKISSINLSNGEKKWYENFDDKGNRLLVQEGASFVIDNKTNIFADIWHTIKKIVSDIVDSVTGLFE